MSKVFQLHLDIDATLAVEEIWPDGELEEKKQRVLDLAEELGIEIDFL